MKIHFEKLTGLPGELLLVKEIKAPKFTAPLHFHPEVELTLILESSGKRFVGDNVENFEAGDLVLVGENLPHFWYNGEDLDTETHAHAIVVQFGRFFLGENFFKITGAEHINNLLINSGRGICVKKPTSILIRKKLIQMLHLDTFGKTLLLISILDIIAKSADFYYLCGADFTPNLNKNDCTRMNKIYDYVYNNISSSFDITDIAALLYMSESAFCHYFKKRTQKTFTRFVNEVRISNAKQLLIETDKPIAEIAYECGYNSLSNFSKQFYSLGKTSPKDFRKNYLINPNS
jgi:AraC-like DNA-binding protein